MHVHGICMHLLQQRIGCEEFWFTITARGLPSTMMVQKLDHITSVKNHCHRKPKDTMRRSSTLLISCLLFVILTLTSGFTPAARRTSVLLFSQAEPSSEAPPVKCPDCDLCDGSGRILGGIPLILPWWPIKPYRPCPNFIKNGGTYTRAGQGLDEIAFGRDSTYPGNN